MRSSYEQRPSSRFLSVAEGEALAARLVAGRLHAGVRGGRIIFDGGRRGTHSLALDASTKARVLAHWTGYVDAELHALSKDFDQWLEAGFTFGIRPSPSTMLRSPDSLTPRQRRWLRDHMSTVTELQNAVHNAVSM